MLPGYKILKEIHRGRRRIVYRGLRQADELPVIIKTLLDEFPASTDVAGLRHEYELIKNLQIAGVAKAYALEQHHKSPALILEDIGGEPLRNLIDSNGIDLEKFFDIGIQLSATIAAVHQHLLIHKDIAPKNIVVNLQSRQVQLIDFSISTRLPHENQKISHPNLLEGTLAYLSPEQTGRMNRAIDYRTDFYSLGVTFYEMLTGKLPFDLTDPLELVHAHIAKMPAPPQALNPNVPQALSDIVMKLLSKTAEDRYQSAHGLQVDLESCRAQWRTNGKVSGFKLGQRDFSDRFQIPQKLYGRELETATLLAAFERAAQGATEIMLVSGYSGIGKSVLVHEVHKPIVRQHGYFITGKFDQFKRNVPYSAVIQAFQELVRQLLTESEEQITAWRDQLMLALGANGQIIIEVIPEVEWIIGKQAPVPELPPAESQNRFNLVFQRFIQVFTQEEHPLVIFLDDLQWADFATLNLLRALTTDPGIHYLFLIGAYRDNEVSAAHPLILTLAEIKKNGAMLSNIVLKPLGMVHLNEFVADTLRCGAGKSKLLADLILQKTDGNPFFVTQFLKSLHQEKLLEFDYQGGHWQFDLERIQRLGMTDNVVELMASKIQKLPHATQHVIKLAACIGNQFDLETLSTVTEEPASQTAKNLWEAVRQGLIIPISDFGLRTAEIFSASEIQNPHSAIYRFLHDRVQQAAYVLIPAERKKALHLKIGQLLLAKSNEIEREERIFDIVNQLDFGLELLAEQKDRRELAALNLAAGKKAKSSTAYQAALGYHKIGINLLKGNSWSPDYDLTLALHLEAAECEYLCGNFDVAERAFDEVLANAQTRLDKAKVYNLKLIQYESLSRYHEAIRLGSEALGLFSLPIPEDAEQIQAALEAELVVINSLIGDRAIASLVNLPAMQNPEMRMVMKLLTNLHTSCFLSGDKPLTLLNTSHMVHLSLVHGNSEESAYAYMLYASMHVVPERQDYKSGYEFGQLALRVNERFYDPAIRAKALMNFAWSVNIWRMPMASSIPIGREAFRLGTETGMFVETAYALFNDCWFALLSDSDLDACRRTCKANVDYTKRIKMFHFAGGAPQVILQWGLALQGLTEHPLSFTDGSFDEEAFRRNYMGQPLFEMFYFDAKLAVLYTFEEYHAACEIAEQAERVIKDFSGTIWDEIRVYYHALTLAALHATATPAERSEIEKNLDAWNARLKKWAENSPYNFRAQHLIVSAEIARLRAQALEAMSLYEAAIAASAEQECPRERALANELCAKFWLNHAQKKVAAVFMQEARSAYAQWGGLAKVKDLEQRYPHLLSPTRTESGTPAADGQASHLTIGRRLEFLDLQTVIKAAQVISGEMTLSRLLEKMMRIVMENAGAQKGILALEKEGELFIEAEGIFGKKANGPATLRGQNGEDEVIALHSIPLEPSGKLALAVVNFVRRTGESLVVPNAVNDSRFAHDTYIVQNQPQSIFCLPILHQSKFIGMLYLENNLTTDAFTPDRIEVMQMLAAQSAIALENARLYEETKQEVAERKHAEEALRAALFEVEQLKNRLQAENVYLQEEIRTQQNYEEIVGASPAIRIVFRNIEKVAPTDSTVLLIGATGTGKELVARAIHSSSHRNANALITVNCGALPSGLIESELFGHEKGAFTGATARKKGRFELADGGTIFLDEIGELPLETQAKLLRVLQEQEFERVGATQTIKVNVRVIAATNRDLEEAVRLGAFRTDLFYRLNIFPIHLPALRERSEDIPTLTNHFVSKFSRRLGKKIDRVSAEALERLTHYVWPGNVRELANVLERAVILCDGGVLQIDHLAISSQVPKPEMEVATLQEAERAHILKALQETKWVVGGPNGAAKRLGLNRTTLLARMKKLGIEKE